MTHATDILDETLAKGYGVYRVTVTHRASDIADLRQWRDRVMSRTPGLVICMDDLRTIGGCRLDLLVGVRWSKGGRVPA